ncbi:MAG: helix-turn-helix domain-containing protein [Thermoflavifilum sp.]|nr:helix-turn-helix domain-containing protein [Thermoflavifilum sp.]
MKKLIILVPDGQPNLISIEGTYRVFRRANLYWQQLGRQQIFDIYLASQRGRVKTNDGLFSVHTMAISSFDRADLIIIPAIGFPYASEINKNQKLIAWIRDQYLQGAEVASICVGLFLLAATGLLNGRRCATHWAAAAPFRQMFPEVQLAEDRVITDEQGIYTNGGAFSFIHLLLYLIEKYYDRQTAVYCAKFFEADMDRYSQLPYMIFSGQKNHDDEIIKQAQAFIEEHFAEKISMEKLANQFASCRRNFDRRFVKATGYTPLEYLQRVRVEAAKRSFENTRKAVNEVMYEVGYADEKAFREVFKKMTGLSPLAYRNKYQKQIMEIHA